MRIMGHLCLGLMLAAMVLAAYLISDAYVQNARSQEARITLLERKLKQKASAAVPIIRVEYARTVYNMGGEILVEELKGKVKSEKKIPTNQTIKR